MTTTEKAIQELMTAAARVRGLDIDDIYILRKRNEKPSEDPTHPPDRGDDSESDECYMEA